MIRKLLVLVLSCFSLSASAMGCYVFGDSLSVDTHDVAGWPTVLVREGESLQVNAVLGRRLVDLIVPPDTKATPFMGCAIIHLGSNDALSGVPAHQFRGRYEQVIDLLVGNGLEVYCVLPPFNDLNWPVQEYRDVVGDICPSPLDVATGFYVDGVHMNQTGMIYHGLAIRSIVQ